jgi:hypothetical protein
MSRFSNYYKQSWPGYLTHFLAWADRHVSPSARNQHRLVTAIGERVMAGPFKGMRFGPFGGDKGFLMRLLGTYEREIYPAIERIVGENPDVVVVAGAGEGYFAVGLARRLPRARLVTFEISKWAQYLLTRHARANGAVLDQRKWCSAPALQDALQSATRPAVLCDIEGGEREVLDPSAVPALGKAVVIVELHPMFVPGIEETIISRFSDTHDIEKMQLEQRKIEDAPAEARSLLSDVELLRAIDEFPLRGTGDWLFLTPKA